MTSRASGLPGVDALAALAVPYTDGYTTGRVDKLLGHRAEYAWQGLFDSNLYTAAFSRGYREGWLGLPVSLRGPDRA